jgi:hypothetical protein
MPSHGRDLGAIEERQNVTDANLLQRDIAHVPEEVNQPSLVRDVQMSICAFSLNIEKDRFQ